jgi:hypothetical protein
MKMDSNIEIEGLPNSKLALMWWVILGLLALGGGVTAILGGVSGLLGSIGYIVAIMVWYFYGRLMQMFFKSNMFALALKLALLDAIKQLEREQTSVPNSKLH